MKHLNDGDWHHEKHTEGYSVSWKINDMIHHESTPFQDLKILDTVQWGKALVLDDCVQTTEKDEFIYHEIISHVLMNAHPNPRRILVVGGGDGGVVREVLKYDCVESVDMVEIDQRVIESCKKYLPDIACGLADSRVRIRIMDGVRFVKEAMPRSYDVVIVDSSDPLGPAAVLFNEHFYSLTSRVMDDDGMLVTQAESPMIYGQVFQDIHHNIKQVFPEVRVYLTAIATYVGGLWAFTVGSKKYDAARIMDEDRIPAGLKYYNKEIHQAIFALPQYIKDLLT